MVEIGSYILCHRFKSQGPMELYRSLVSCFYLQPRQLCHWLELTFDLKSLVLSGFGTVDCWQYRDCLRINNISKTGSCAPGGSASNESLSNLCESDLI